MSLDDIDRDALIDGAAGLDSAYELSPIARGRLVDRILDESKYDGGAPSTTALSSSSDGNAHLSGPYYDGHGR